MCAVVDIKNQTLPVHHPDQTYVCEGDGLLDDPFEGELFTWWLQFFGGLSEADIEGLWESKRAQLVSVDYHMGNVGPITVQKGEMPWIKRAMMTPVLIIEQDIGSPATRLGR